MESDDLDVDTQRTKGRGAKDSVVAVAVGGGDTRVGDPAVCRIAAGAALVGHGNRRRLRRHGGVDLSVKGKDGEGMGLLPFPALGYGDAIGGDGVGQGGGMLPVGTGEGGGGGVPVRGVGLDLVFCRGVGGEYPALGGFAGGAEGQGYGGGDIHREVGGFCAGLGQADGRGGSFAVDSAQAARVVVGVGVEVELQAVASRLQKELMEAVGGEVGGGIRILGGGGGDGLVADEGGGVEVGGRGDHVLIEVGVALTAVAGLGGVAVLDMADGGLGQPFLGGLHGA